ncbi:lytic transglycosylase domain-containing protein [Lonsdalea quercina]|uniref:lytic transglycosylase domain-containing protein n=1 Tax=Lonsdalea quercina TaxID=71657 RepID=UPI00397511E1
MIIEELAYKVTVRAEEFLSGKKKVEQGYGELESNASDAMEGAGKSTKKAGGELESMGRKVKKTAEDTRRPFGLISGGFSKAAKGAKEFGQEGKEAFSGVQAGAAKFLGLALSIEGARRLFTSSVNNAVDLKNASSFLDMDPKAVDGLKKSAISVGSSAESIMNTMMKLKNAKNWSVSPIGAPDEFTQSTLQLGTQTNVDIIGSKDPGEMFKRTEEALRKLPKEQAEIWSQRLSIDNSLLPSILDGSFDKNQKQFQNKSPYSEKMAEEAAAVKVKMVDLDQAIEGVGNKLVLAFGPSVTKGLEDFGQWVTDHQDDVIGFFKTGSDWAGKFADSVGGTSNALSSLAALYATLKIGGAKTLVGKAGLAGAAAVVSEPVVDYGLNQAFGKSDYFQAIRTANTWSDFGKALLGNNGGAKWIDGKWVDPRIDDSGRKDKEDAPAQHAQSFKKESAESFSQDKLLQALMMTESAGNPNAVNPKSGATGAYQFMPETARDMGLRIDDRVDERRDPVKSREAANKYLNQLINRYGGNVDLALMAYNAGMGRIDKHLEGKGEPLKSETLEYPGKVANYYQQLTQMAAMAPAANMQSQNVDNSQSSSTHINSVQITTNPQTVDEIARSIDEQRRRSTMTGSFISGNG